MDGFGYFFDISDTTLEEKKEGIVSIPELVALDAISFAGSIPKTIFFF